MRADASGGSEVLDSLAQSEDSLTDYEEIIAVYLFGSHAQGRDNRLSDVDLGLLIHKDVSVVRQHQLRLDLMSFFFSASQCLSSGCSGSEQRSLFTRVQSAS